MFLELRIKLLAVCWRCQEEKGTNRSPLLLCCVLAILNGDTNLRLGGWSPSLVLWTKTELECEVMSWREREELNLIVLDRTCVSRILLDCILRLRAHETEKIDHDVLGTSVCLGQGSLSCEMSFFESFHVFSMIHENTRDRFSISESCECGSDLTSLCAEGRGQDPRVRTDTDTSRLNISGPQKNKIRNSLKSVRGS